MRGKGYKENEGPVFESIPEEDRRLRPGRSGLADRTNQINIRQGTTKRGIIRQGFNEKYIVNTACLKQSKIWTPNEPNKTKQY